MLSALLFRGFIDLIFFFTYFLLALNSTVKPGEQGGGGAETEACGVSIYLGTVCAWWVLGFF